MAVVHRAFDERLGRDVAVKMLEPRRGLDVASRARFESEARAAGAISHPNVVAVHDVGTEGDVLFIVMECLTGPTFAEELRHGPLPVSRALDVLTDVLAGLAAAHAKGVLHRDIKSSNIIMDGSGRAKLADFGIATTGDSDLTATGMVIGTATYLAPERLAGERATISSDIYAVGVVAYEALTGERPFTGDSPVALAHSIRVSTPLAVRDWRPDVPTRLSDTVMRAITREPEQRPPTADAFAQQLRGIPEPDGAPAAAAPTLPTPTAPTATAPAATAAPRGDDTRTQIATTDGALPTSARRRTKRWVALVLAAVVVAGLLAGTLWWRAGDGGDSGGTSPTVTTVPSPPLPPELQAPFDRLEQAVQR
jgi:serine/threonine-protein kinase